MACDTTVVGRILWPMPFGVWKEKAQHFVMAKNLRPITQMNRQDAEAVAAYLGGKDTTEVYKVLMVGTSTLVQQLSLVPAGLPIRKAV